MKKWLALLLAAMMALALVACGDTPANRCQPPTCLVAIQSQIHQVCSTKILFQLRIQIPVIVS